jgi:2-polyprenyl-6-methoxyphenol hydroxylase-like FAD-dependent oxidoreductase
MQIFEQSANEQLLSRSLAAAGTDVLWRHRLIDLIDDAGQAQGQVTALLDGPAGLVRVRARWCIGADGARSAVRRELDIPFEGVTDDATFWVADLRGVRGLPDHSMAARFGDATFAVAFPLGPAGHTRLVALAPRDDIGQQEALAAARADLGLAYDGVDWFSSYRVHHRVATVFRKGSVFLAGDAGHVHSPVGGQGMNTGLQDAHNLALLLADVRQGRLNTAALDRYEQERRPVAVMLVKVTDRLFGFIGRRNRRAALLRRRVSAIGAHLAPRLLSTRFGRRIGGYLGQYRIRYHFAAGKGPAPTWAADRVVGLRLPPVPDNHVPLRTLAWQVPPSTRCGRYSARPAPRPRPAAARHVADQPGDPPRLEVRQPAIRSDRADMWPGLLTATNTARPTESSSTNRKLTSRHNCPLSAVLVRPVRVAYIRILAARRCCGPSDMTARPPVSWGNAGPSSRACCAPGRPRRGTAAAGEPQAPVSALVAGVS